MENIKRGYVDDEALDDRHVDGHDCEMVEGAWQACGVVALLEDTFFCLR